MESLEYLDLEGCSSLEKFPKILGRDLVAIPSSIFSFQKMVKLDVRCCYRLERLPEEMGHFENLEKLNAKYTRISQPPSSIVRLNKLKYLRFAKHKSMFLKALPAFVFPRVNEGLRSLEELDLSYCNLIDGGLPEDIGCLSSLKVLRLKGSKFSYLPRSIAHLCALQFLDLAYCKRLRELPELPPNIVTLRAQYHLALENTQNFASKYMKLQVMTFTSLYGIEADYDHDQSDDDSYVESDDVSDEFDDSINDLLAETLFQCIFSLQHAFSASDSLSQRMITLLHPGTKVPSSFHLKGMGKCLIVSLPENWYVNGNFLGFALCYIGLLEERIYEVKLLCNDDESEQLGGTIECNRDFDFDRDPDGAIFLFIPFASIWDTSKANGKTPNDYGLLKCLPYGEMEELGVRLLYKDELEPEPLLQNEVNNDESTVVNTMTL